MRKTVFCTILVLISLIANSQTTITVGNTDPTYQTLGSAFSFLNNSGGDLGDVTIQITGNTTELSTAVLYPSGTDIWSTFGTVTIYPVASGYTISGTGFDGPVIRFNGVTGVTIDGSAGGSGTSKDLTITNTTAGGSANTIEFINDASSNIVRNCVIKGSSLASAGGIIYFGTTTGTTGNDGNRIENNNITNDAAGRPLNAVYSAGTSGAENSGNQILNNDFYDFLNSGTISTGITLSAFTTGWTISGNSFYEKTSFSATAGVEYRIINIDNSSGAGFTVSGNYIGGKASQCGSTAWTKTSYDTPFYGLYIYVGSASPTSIQNNTIKKLTWTNTGPAAFTGIYLKAGTINIGDVTGNTIGSSSGSESITFTGAAGASIYGLQTASGVTINCNNNLIANLVNNTTSSGLICGIDYDASTGSNVVNANFINSLSVINSSTTSTIYGIRISGGATTWSNNIISLTGTTQTTIYGISESGAAGNNNSLYFNTIFIGGTATTGTNKSFSLYSAVSTNTRNIRNNIIENARSTTGGSNLHYAVWFDYGVSTGLTLNYNDYYVFGTGTVLGYYNSANVTSTPLVPGNDANSLNLDPVFNSPGGTSAANYVATTYLAGISGTGITTDYYGSARVVPIMGALESGACTNPTSGGTIAGTQAGCSPFDPSPITSSTLPSGHSGSLEYKWQFSTNGGSSYSDISSSNLSSYDPGFLTQTTLYKRLARVTCMSDWTGAAESNAITITIYANPTATITGTLNACGSTTLTANTNASSPSYIWYKNSSTIPGETSSTLLVIDAGDYQVKITDGVTSCKQTSSVATVTISTLPSASVTGVSPACTTTTLTAVTDASSPSYVWYKDDVVISGQTASTLVATASGGYKVNVTNTSSGCSFTSSAKSVTINPLPNTGLTVSGPGTICSGTGTNITVASSESGVNYQLRIGVSGVGSPVSGNTTTINLPTGNLSSTTTFNVLATNASTSCSAQLAQTATVNIDPVSAGGSISGTTTITYGSSTGTMTLSSYTGTIQRWEKRLNSGSWSSISNTNATYSETPTTAGTWGYRAVVKSGVCTEANSSELSITVNKATPVITWGNPADIVEGTALSSTQLNATTTVTGTFIYTPASGTVLSAGLNQSLSVAFTPDDAVNYNTANKSVLINVMVVTAVEDLSLRKLIVYPNPANGIITIDGLSSVSNDKPVTLLISDNSGKTIIIKQLEKNIKTLTLDIGRYDSGVYFIVLQTDKEKIVKQFVKQ